MTSATMVKEVSVGLPNRVADVADRLEEFGYRLNTIRCTLDTFAEEDSKKTSGPTPSGTVAAHLYRANEALYRMHIHLDNIECTLGIPATPNESNSPTDSSLPSVAINLVSRLESMRGRLAVVKDTMQLQPTNDRPDTRQFDGTLDWYICEANTLSHDINYLLTGIEEVLGLGPVKVNY